MREKIFIGTLDENDCGDEDVRNFLNFFQYKDSNRRTRHSPLTELEWEMIVKKLRKTAPRPYFPTETIQCINAI